MDVTSNIYHLILNLFLHSTLKLLFIHIPFIILRNNKKYNVQDIRTIISYSSFLLINDKNVVKWKILLLFFFFYNQNNKFFYVRNIFRERKLIFNFLMEFCTFYHIQTFQYSSILRYQDKFTYVRYNDFKRDTRSGMKEIVWIFRIVSSGVHMSH